jgi:hypothetical protein
MFWVTSWWSLSFGLDPVSVYNTACQEELCALEDKLPHVKVCFMCQSNLLLSQLSLFHQIGHNDTSVCADPVRSLTKHVVWSVDACNWEVCVWPEGAPVRMVYVWPGSLCPKLTLAGGPTSQSPCGYSGWQNSFLEHSSKIQLLPRQQWPLHCQFHSERGGSQWSYGSLGRYLTHGRGWGKAQLSHMGPKTKQVSVFAVENTFEEKSILFEHKNILSGCWAKETFEMKIIKLTAQVNWSSSLQ